MSKLKKRNIAISAISSIVAWTLFLIHSFSASLNENNLIYAIGEKRAYNGTLFNDNVYMGEGVISPRYIIDEIFAVMMHINGGDWAGADLIWLYFGAALFSIAVANVARKINSEHQIILTAVFSCLVLYCNNDLAGFSLYELSTTGMGTAIAFSIFAISFLIGEKRNYNVAWCLAGCAIICHIHEGIYCCAVIFIIALVDCLFQKHLMLRENIGVIVAITALMLVTVPSLLTDSMNITDTEFVYIYSFFRHPHHLVPSSWNVDLVYKSIWVDVAFLGLGLQANYLLKKDSTKKKLVEAGILVCAWIVAITIMYVFTEIKPIAMISTLFISKFFKYVLLIALIWIVRAFIDLRINGYLISGYLVLGFGFLATSFELKWIALLFCIVIIVMLVEKDFVERKVLDIPSQYYLVFDVIFFVLLICIKRENIDIKVGSIVELLVAPKEALSSSLIGITIVLVFFAAFVTTFALEKKIKCYKILCFFACVCMIGLSFVQRVVVYNSDDGTISLISGEMALKNSMSADLYELAENFNQLTDINQAFLAEPDEIQTGWFQLVSERNCYVVNKVIPSSKVTTDEWYTRYILTAGICDKSIEEIENIMDISDISYLLVSALYYDKFAETTDFEVFTTSTEDSYRVYKCVKN